MEALRASYTGHATFSDSENKIKSATLKCQAVEYHVRSFCPLNDWKKKMNRSGREMLFWLKNRLKSTKNSRQTFAPIQWTNHEIWHLELFV